MIVRENLLTVAAKPKILKSAQAGARFE
jgi:Fur family iron response transcriptional regulator